MNLRTGKKRIAVKLTGSAWICLFMILALSVFTPNFFTISNLKNLIRQGSVLALVAFGQTFVILIEGIDLSAGAVMGLVSCTAAVLMVQEGVPLIIAVILALIVAVICGLINGFISNYIGLNPFIATYGMQAMALGLALVLTKERVIFGIPESLSFLNYGELAGIPIPLVIVLIMGVGLNYFLTSTTHGIATHAIGGNVTTAELSGIRVRFHKTMIYTFSGLMAGIAGIMFLARCNAAQGIDTIGFEFDSIAAVVAGGTSLYGGKGGIYQTIIGVALITIVRNGMNLVGVNSYLQMVVIGSILILAYTVGNKKNKRDASFG